MRSAYASTDVGDVSYTTPTAGMVAADGMDIGRKGAAVAAKTLALTATNLFGSPDTIAAAKAELDKRRGPGFVYRPLLGDMPPALDYRKNGKTTDLAA